MLVQHVAPVAPLRPRRPRPHRHRLQVVHRVAHRRGQLHVPQAAEAQGLRPALGGRVRLLSSAAFEGNLPRAVAVARGGEVREGAVEGVGSHQAHLLRTLHKDGLGGGFSAPQGVGDGKGHRVLPRGGERNVLGANTAQRPAIAEAPRKGRDLCARRAGRGRRRLQSDRLAHARPRGLSAEESHGLSPRRAPGARVARNRTRVQPARAGGAGDFRQRLIVVGSHVSVQYILNSIVGTGGELSSPRGDEAAIHIVVQRG
mmetsp:Transcript_46380/g.148632  ORF Transcript_46380/g.148632 Transcript_46380/m.148632 type:complete len:258 (-) Transcript_46380:682-1455(-)